MPLILPGNVGSATAATGFNVANSCRFNGDAYVHKAVVAGNQRTFTYSFWTKRSTLNNYDTFIGYAGSAGGGGSTNRGELIFVGDGDDTLRVGFNPGGSSWSNYTMNTGVFRDPSAWYNIVLKVNTTSGTEAERLKIFVNGVSQGLSGYPGQNFDTGFNVDGYVYHIGRSASGTGNFIKGYLAEAVFIDGTALDADSFGEFDDSGIWKPIDVSGLTFGNNGFYLDFEASGNLGNDANGGTDLTEVSLAATDQSTDTCTNNFATLNPLMNNVSNLPTLSEGNLEVLAVSGSTWSVTPSTIGLPKSGKWYYEVEAVSGTSGDRAAFAGWMNPAVSNPLNNGSILWRNTQSSNSIISNNSAASGTFSATTWGTNGHIIGMYIDMDNSKLYFAHNGTIQNSGTGIDFQGTFDDDTFILPVVMVINTDKLSVNFGNPAANFAIASGNTDVNGFGNFEFDPSSGTFDGASKDFLAICTKNLAEFG